MKKKMFTALQVLGNAAGIVSGAVAMHYSSKIKGMDIGSGASYKTYGGDAYTGIQNASAQVSYNVCDLSEIVRDSFSLLLFVIGLALICYFVTNLIKVLADYFTEDVVRTAGVTTETSYGQEVSSSEYATKLPNPTVAPHRESSVNQDEPIPVFSPESSDHYE